MNDIIWKQSDYISAADSKMAIQNERPMFKKW